MAKRCLDKIIVDGVDYPLMQLNDFSIFNNYTGWDTNCSNAGYSYISSYGSDIMAIGGDRWISYGEHKYWDIENSNDAFVGLIGFNRNVSTKNICFDENDLDCRTRNSYVSSNQNMNMWCTIIVDDETELGFAIIVRQFPNGGTKDAWIYNDSNNDYAYCKKIYQCFGNVAQKITSNGGGATHIAKVTGQLKDLSSNLSDILIVSGGGGGGLLVGETEYTGKEAGGISGSGDNSADQSTGNAFGQGESGTNVSGGGSGLYGGYKGTSSKSGGAGSGYIGNSLLSNKKMVGYNVPTSSAEGTKTESVNEASESPVSGKPKIGNGFARIKMLREYTYREYAFADLIQTSDISHYKYDNSYNYNNLKQYKNTGWNLLLLPGTSGDGNNAFRSQSGLDVYNIGTTNGSEQYYHFKLKKRVHITKIECDIQMPSYLGDAGLLFMSGVKEDGDNWSRFSIPDVSWGYWVEKGTNRYNAIEHWSSGDTSWHHLSVDYDVTTEYLNVMVYHVPCNIKNIVITVLEEK